MNLWRHYGVHVTWVQFTDQIENEAQILHLKFYMGYWLQTLSDMLGWQKNYFHDIIMVVMWLDTIYRSERKWGPDLVSQVLHTLLTSNFVRYVKVTKELLPWHHHGSHVTWVQFTDKIENEDQIWYLKFYVQFWLKNFQSYDNKWNRKLMLRINAKWFNIILDKGFSFLI